MPAGQDRSAIGGGSDSNTVQYNTQPNMVRDLIQSGDEFVLFVKSRQSDQIKAWSSGDRTETQHLFNQAAKELDLTPA